MRYLYSIGIYIYALLIHFASLFSPKAKKWVNGRKKLFLSLEKSLSDQENMVWFHCASLGEFEQGRPVMEEYRKRYPSDKILLTFFSPSGYEVRKNYSGADFIFYLPIDTPQNVKRFLDVAKPKMIFFIKYEFWFNYLYYIQKRNIPCYLISGIFRPTQMFFQFYGQWTFRHLRAFDHFFIQDEASGFLLKQQELSNYTISGDTRFDRVVTVAKNKKDLPEIKKFCDDKFILISGSSWEQEDQLLVQLLKGEKYDGKIIIAPHEVSETRSEKLLNQFQGKAMLWSERENQDIEGKQVLIIDTIGLLSSIYQYADVALIGGGFGTGVHNVLEAATFGIPIIIGPNHEKFNEVRDLLNNGAALEVNNQKEFIATFFQLKENTKLLKEKGQIAKNYVTNKSGATSAIMEYLDSKESQE